jgi:hypothetical protein
METPETQQLQQTRLEGALHSYMAMQPERFGPAGIDSKMQEYICLLGDIVEATPHELTEDALGDRQGYLFDGSVQEGSVMFFDLANLGLIKPAPYKVGIRDTREIRVHQNDLDRITVPKSTTDKTVTPMLASPEGELLYRDHTQHRGRPGGF